MRNRNLITGRRRAPINVLVTVLLAAASSLVLAPSADATTLIRKSKNHCAEASIEYEYFDDGEGTFDIVYEGLLFWQSYDLGCGERRQPYAGVLQWKGVHWGKKFGWEDAPNGYDDDGVIEQTIGSGFKDVQFRVCNWNTETGAVGTCP